MLKTFTKENIKSGDQIIIYGAAMYGEIALNALRASGLNAMAFCDRVQADTFFCGLPVISPNQLVEYKDAHVLICATKGFQGIKSYLESLKWENYYEISELIKCVDFSSLRQYCRQLSIDELVKKYQFYVEGEKGETLDLSFLALSITERCTLKCEKCSVLAPYYKNPSDDELKVIIEPLQRLLMCVDSIAEMQIGGGEPFMHKRLEEILLWCIEQEKIKEISIFTNSTIVPKDGLIRVLKNKKIKLLLDDYGELSRNLPAIKQLCDKHDIRYIIQRFSRWDDLGDFSEKKYSEAQVEKIFKFCSFGNVMSFMKGKLYRCTTAARIADLGIVQETEDDYISFLEENFSVKEKQQEIRDLIYRKKYHNGCKYCNGISTNKLGIPVAVQMEA